MIELKRNEKIVKEYNNRDTTYKELGRKYGLTPQRIEKIINSDLKYCDIHQNYFYSGCLKCSKNKNINLILSKNKNVIDILLKDMMHVNATMEIKHKVVRILKDKYKLSFSKIAKLVHKNHSTIIYYYNK